MHYVENMAAAARKNFGAAEHLRSCTTAKQVGHHGVAGYLYGFAAECAIKDHLERMYGKPLPRAHFPELKELFRARAKGRRSARLWKRLLAPSFLYGWETTIRYVSSDAVDADMVERWRQDAHFVMKEYP